MKPPIMPENATDEQIDTYLKFWRVRGARICEIMGWRWCYAFDPRFYFEVDDKRCASLDLDVVEKMIELADNQKEGS